MTDLLAALAPVIMEEVDWLEPIAAAAAIARDQDAFVAAVLIGGDDHKARAALDAGADAAWLVSHPDLGYRRPDDAQLTALFAQALSHAELQGHRLALVPSGTATEMMAAALSVRLDGAALGLCADITLSATGLTFCRPAYGGRAQMVLTDTDTRCYAAVRARKVDNVAKQGPIHLLPLTEPLPSPLPVTRRDSGLSVPNLEGAKVVVSGGRGMGGEEGFALLSELAGCLGGALGGSLPTVDAGWLPVFRQVGQSGKFVTPEVYVAVGISGTPQHLAGIGPNTRIAAINKDAEADIFRFADIGIVADWKDVLPALVARLKESTLRH